MGRRSTGGWCLYHRAMELRYGIRTEGDVDLEELSVAAAAPAGLRGLSLGRGAACPSAARGHAARRVRRLRGRARPAVLVAATFPFRRALGVEVSDDLTPPARPTSSVRACARAGRVEFVTADVLEFEIPDDLSVVYLYNPFTGPAVRAIRRAPAACRSSAARGLRVVYNYPFEHDYLIATGRFRPIDLTHSYWPAWYRRPGYVIVTYEALTADGRVRLAAGKRSSPGLASALGGAAPAGSSWAAHATRRGRGPGA